MKLVVSAMVTLLIIAFSPATHADPAICEEEPAGWFDRCGGHRYVIPLQSPAVAGEASNFDLTDGHAVWAASANPAAQLFYATRPTTCDMDLHTGPMTLIPGSNTIEYADASSANGGSSVYFNVYGGWEIKGVRIPSLTTFTPAPGHQLQARMPAAQLVSFRGFVYNEDGNLFACASESCTDPQLIQVTNIPDGDQRNPRFHGTTVVWDASDKIFVADLSTNPIVPTFLDSGRRPDINSRYIVYEKLEPPPDPSCTTMGSRRQIWYYDRQTGVSGRVSSHAFWGPHSYSHPRLTENYLFVLADFVYLQKTVVALYPVASFGDPEPMLELSDDGAPPGVAKRALAGYEVGSFVQALYSYRDASNVQAAIACCSPEP